MTHADGGKQRPGTALETGPRPGSDGDARPEPTSARPVPEEALLVAEDLTVDHGRTRALRSVSLSLPDGGLLLVLGANGAGKTTLVKALAGAVRLRSGRVRLGGVTVTRLPAHRRLRAGVSLVPEGRGTLRGLSVHDNLQLGLASCPRERRIDRAQALSEVLELFPVLGKRSRQDCSTLSGGEMQMLAIARALLSRPRVLLLDEPSLGLAPAAVARVYDALGRLNDAGLAIVLVEQKAVPLPRPPSTTLVLHTGQVVYEAHGRRPDERELAALYLGEGAGP